MAKTWQVDPEALKAVQDAMDNVDIKGFAVRGTKEVAEATVVIAQMNLNAREGGGKYSRAVADVDTVEDSDGWGAVLFTPWFGMEFGGHITNVWGHRIGTGRQDAIGLEPMWAPWHRDVEQGYILGGAWAEMDEDKATEILADAGLEAYTVAFDNAGVPEGR